ncbi:hypothetical protein CHISP_1881 [Chitinispirillum alkaliphilum]|nr:hypothetical protein CHISP_1881 [Chitinispirillum alkaliphilum]
MKPIFEYLDYQLYLKDFYEYKKDQSSYFSYRYMGNKLNLDAGFLVKVLQGKANISNKSIPVIVRFLKLEAREAEYFDLLVRFAKAKTGKECEFLFERIMALRGIDMNRVEDRQYEFYSHWYHNAIRALLSYYSFQGDYKELAKLLSPPITEKQAEDSISLLLSMGFIKRDKLGFFVLTDKTITTGEKWHSPAIHAFQKETISMARESLDRHTKEIRDISSVTISVSHKDLEEIKARASEFRKSLLQMHTGNSPSDIVYQVNIQIVPLTGILGHEEN